MTKFGKMIRWGMTGGIAVVLAGMGLNVHAAENAIGKTADDAAETTRNTLGNAAETTGNTVGNAAETTGNTVGNAAKSAGETTGNAASSAANSIANETSATNPNDESITARAKKKLNAAGGEASKIDVGTEHGVLTLSGTVTSESARMHAVKEVRGLKGVNTINDEIKVKPNK